MSKCPTLTVKSEGNYREDDITLSITRVDTGNRHFYFVFFT